VQPAGELLVFGRVADEDRVELGRLIQQRGQVVDQFVRQANTAQEGEW
jgi:hypothetical protein